MRVRNFVGELVDKVRRTRVVGNGGNIQPSELNNGGGGRLVRAQKMDSLAVDNWGF